MKLYYTYLTNKAKDNFLNHELVSHTKEKSSLYCYSFIKISNINNYLINSKIFIHIIYKRIIYIFFTKIIYVITYNFCFP